jgi:PEP-CTERM motif
MKLTPKHLTTSALVAASLFASAGAMASVVYLPAENSLIQGAGLGAVNTVLTLGSPGSSSTETGAVFAAGAGFSTSGDVFTGASQVGLPSLAALGITSASALRIILNAVEPSGDSITVSNLGLSFFDASGLNLHTFSLAAPLTLPSTLTGIGNAGFVFGLDAAQAAQAATYIGTSSTPFANIRVGLSATLNNATGGHETFFVATSPIPEPQTYALILAGLAGIGFMVRRRLS